MKIKEFIFNGLKRLCEWFIFQMRVNWTRLVVGKIRQLPAEQLCKFLKTGKGRIDVGGQSIEVTPLRETVLKKIQEACQDEGFVDQREIVNHFREEYGRRCGVAAMEEIYLLVKDGVISREQKGEITILKLL